jgi:hypothetical protein
MILVLVGVERNTNNVMVKMPNVNFQLLTLSWMMLCISFSPVALAQQTISDTTIQPVQKTSMVHKDPRIDLLGQEMAEYNVSLSKKIKMGKGYRLMIISSTNRAEVMRVRSTLLQSYPEHKLYLSFLAPYLKLKMGNFLTNEEALEMKKELIKLKIVSGAIYIVPEQVEIIPPVAPNTTH